MQIIMDHKWENMVFHQLKDHKAQLSSTNDDFKKSLIWWLLFLGLLAEWRWG